MEMTVIKEQKRIYYYWENDAPNKKLAFNNIVGFKDSKTTHRLLDDKGNHYIVPKDNLAYIMIEGIDYFTV